MYIDREKQLSVIEQTNQILHSTESERMLLRFQRGLADLDKNRFKILQNNEFVDNLVEYLHNSSQAEPEQTTLKVLEQLGYCACNGDKELRERAIFILSVFIEKILQANNKPQFLEVVSRLLVDWLQLETEYIAGFPLICRQLQAMLQKMLQLGLWYQTEKLIIILSRIQNGTIQKHNLIRQTISKVHSSLADETFLKNLVDVYLDIKEDRRDIAQCLLKHFGSKAAAVLVQYLIDCQNKEERFSLLDFIPKTGRVALPVCDSCLKQNPPWYVIRNLIIIISRMEDPELYEMVRPYLTHKDIRVQLQILNCIKKLGGAKMRDRLIEALFYMNDELKQQVVVQLGNIGGKDVGNAFCSLLEKRHEFALHVQDDLLVTICVNLQSEPSERAIMLVRELISERFQQPREGDQILQAAQDALASMEPENTGMPIPGNIFISPFAYLPGSDAATIFAATEEELDSAPETDLCAGEENQEQLSATPTLSQDDKTAAAIDKAGQSSKEDIIEEAKRNPNDPDFDLHFTNWAKLYEDMTAEEFLAFQDALSLRTYKPKERIIAQGDLQAPLFLIDSGTVNVVRNVVGEKAHLQAIGAGDLIGSDIFLTGQAWNLSLYAQDLVTARIFDLENLLNMQVKFPRLAEIIFTFCSGHDILQALCRVLDDPDSAGTENVQINRKKSTKKSKEDNLQKGILLKKLRGGLCFSIPAKAGEKLDDLLDKKLELSIRHGKVEVIPATVVGTLRSVAKSPESVVFVRFPQPLDDARYICESIGFPEAV